MNKTILLARPHPFVAPVMRPFLEEAGYAVSISDGKSDLSAGTTDSSGAIISIAVVSSVGEAAETVFGEIRRISPSLPVAFAGLLEFDKARLALKRVGEACDVEITPLGVIPGSESNPGLGRPETFVYFSKNDLSDPKKRGLATRLLRRHFR
jgi:hypothetical protein